MPPRKSRDSPKSDNQTSWTEEHTLAVVRLIIASALAARPVMYADPALADINGNGGNRINQKLRSILTTLAKQHPGAEDFVNEETERIQASKTGGKKRTAGDESKSSPARKRVKEEA